LQQEIVEGAPVGLAPVGIAGDLPRIVALRLDVELRLLVAAPDDHFAIETRLKRDRPHARRAPRPKLADLHLHVEGGVSLRIRDSIAAAGKCLGDEVAHAALDRLALGQHDVAHRLAVGVALAADVLAELFTGNGIHIALDRGNPRGRGFVFELAAVLHLREGGAALRRGMCGGRWRERDHAVAGHAARGQQQK